MLFRPPDQVRRTARRLASLGVDRVRLTASWSTIAPEPLARRRPTGFHAADPAAYPRGAWRALDRAVAETHRAGMRPMVDVAFWAPRWAVERGVERPRQERWRPSPRELGLFAAAVARRYSGRYRDPVTRARPPAVRLWTTWNEPNHPVFLLPQWERRGGGLRPASPHLYRDMHERAYAAITRASPANRVLVGGLSSLGGDSPGPRTIMPPLAFLRELACVDARLRPLRRPECRGFRPLRADGFSYHPYNRRRAPDVPAPGPDNAGTADLGRLSTLLADLHRRGRIERRLEVYVTEFGYETDPPDRLRGVPPRTQARWLSQAASIMLARHHVPMQAQFLLQDVPEPGLYQTGLLFRDGRPKPALSAFRMPFWVHHGVASGQVRPGRGRQRVAIERQAADGSWRSATPSFQTNEAGVFRRRLERRGRYRLRWEPRGAPPERSFPSP